MSRFVIAFVSSTFLASSLIGADPVEIIKTPDGGFQPGAKSMGVLACLDACRFVLNETPTRTIVDPFCGWGTVLAVANSLGLDAIGVDLSARMCKRARRLTVPLVE